MYIHIHIYTMRLVSSALNYVIYASRKHGIDESHSLGHSLAVLDNAYEIFNATVSYHPQLKHQQDIIQCACILHDMCDKKYMNEEEGMREIREHLGETLPPHKIDVVSAIIQSMSYSTVKARGYPELGAYQTAYHVVREADLLSAYDYNRAVMFHMLRNGKSYPEALADADEVMKKRVLRYVPDRLFVTEFSKYRARILHYRLLEYLEKHRGKHFSKVIHLSDM